MTNGRVRCCMRCSVLGLCAKMASSRASNVWVGGCLLCRCIGVSSCFYAVSCPYCLRCVVICGFMSAFGCMMCFVYWLAIRPPAALKEVCKLLQNDDSMVRTMYLQLGKWRTFQQYLLPLLIAYRHDKRIVFHCGRSHCSVCGSVGMCSAHVFVAGCCCDQSNCWLF